MPSAIAIIFAIFCYLKVCDIFFQDSEISSVSEAQQVRKFLRAAAATQLALKKNKKTDVLELGRGLGRGLGRDLFSPPGEATLDLSGPSSGSSSSGLNPGTSPDLIGSFGGPFRNRKKQGKHKNKPLCIDTDCRGCDKQHSVLDETDESPTP